MRPILGWSHLLLLAAITAGAADPAHATRYCDAQGRLSAEQQDKLLRFGAVIKAELDKSGAQVALISRSGLDLGRFNVRYSHAGISLKASPDTPWAVRQLYFACDANKPLLFDQGMAAFLMGTDEPAIGYVSVVLLPAEAAVQLEQTALDKRSALQLLGASYSANAYPFALRHQNCNQWVVELLAAAWGERDVDSGGTSAASAATAAAPDTEPRLRAQTWLQTQGYAPAVFDVGWRPLMWLAAVIPWLHRDDHPAVDLEAQRFRVSMPSSIEAFVQQRLPGATRIEFCHDSRRVVVRRGWNAIADGCQAAAGDAVVPLD